MSLIYSAIQTRPDFAVSVGIYGIVVSTSTQTHRSEVKRILRYVLGTRAYGLQLGANLIDDVILEAYSNADWAGGHDDGKLRSGFVSLIVVDLFSYASKEQPRVATSSTQADVLQYTK